MSSFGSIWKSLVRLLMIGVVVFMRSYAVVSVAGGSEFTATDCRALSSIQPLIPGTSTSSLPNCCNWLGVQCTEGKIIELDLTVTKKVARNHSDGQRWIFLCELKNLQKLNVSVSQNALRKDFLPTCVWNMTELLVLMVTISEPAGNSMEQAAMKGITLPTSINASRLQDLMLEGVGLSGDLPDSLGTLPQLKTLRLRFNNIKTIPESVGRLGVLRLLDVRGNQIQRLPESLGNLSRLQKLDVSRNQIMDLPDSFRNLSRLTYVTLQNNNLTSIPMPLAQANLPLLRKLVIRDNFVDRIPEIFGPFEALSSLDLSGNVISGSISGAFCLLQNLTELNLSNTNITDGFLPPCLGVLPNLRRLGLARNHLSIFPSFVCNLTSLQFLDLHWNMISKIPSFGNLPNLIELELHRNSLTNISGSLSSGGFPALSHLYLRKNFLLEIPVWMGALTNLTYLDISCNNLMGTIPPSLGQLPRLEILDLHGNSDLHGEVPEGFPVLSALLLHFNRLTGAVPAFVFTSTTLTAVMLSENRFTSLPQSFNCSSGSMKKLHVLEMLQNNISGPFPPSFCDCSNLQVLEMSSNNIRGGIPHDLNKCSKLRVLNFGNNSMSGTIPRFLGDSLPDLALLDLSSNQLTGRLPSNLGNSSPKLSLLNFANNSLEGPIPKSLGMVATNLAILRLEHNNLGGSIPKSLSRCKKLKMLALTSNNLTGTLPFDLKSLSGNLMVLLVGSNYLEGPFPTWLMKFSNLQTLDLSGNKFFGVLPRNYSYLDGFIELNVSGQIKGEDVTIIWKGAPQTFEYRYPQQVRTSFDISRNSFNGTIPTGLEKLQGIEHLNVSYNSFEGHIPPQLSSLAMLEGLDLSSNNLTGSLPATIFQISYGNFNVSFNNLYGEIPTGGTRYAVDSFLGNDGLCGLPLGRCEIRPLRSDPESENGGSDDSGGWIELNALYAGFIVSFVAVLLGLALTEAGKTYVLFTDRDPCIAKMNSFKGRGTDLHDHSESGSGWHESKPVIASADSVHSQEVWTERARVLSQMRLDDSNNLRLSR